MINPFYTTEKGIAFFILKWTRLKRNKQTETSILIFGYQRFEPTCAFKVMVNEQRMGKFLNMIVSRFYLASSL